MLKWYLHVRFTIIILTVLSTLVSLFFLFFFTSFIINHFSNIFSNTLLKLGNNTFPYMNTFTRKHVFDTINVNVSFIMRLIYFLVKIYNIKFIGSNCFFPQIFFYFCAVINKNLHLSVIGRVQKFVTLTRDFIWFLDKRFLFPSMHL